MGEIFSALWIHKLPALGQITEAGIFPILEHAMKEPKHSFPPFWPHCYRNTPTQAHSAQHRLLRFLVFLLRYMFPGLLSLVNRHLLIRRPEYALYIYDKESGSLNRPCLPTTPSEFVRG